MLMRRTFTLYVSEETYKESSDAELEKLIERHDNIFDMLEDVARASVKDCRIRLTID